MIRWPSVTLWVGLMCLLPSCGDAPSVSAKARVPAATVRGAGHGVSSPYDVDVIFVSIDCLNQRQLEQAIEGDYAPGLAKLRGEALGFNRAYSHAPWTTPSHMSMLTGLYPSEHGRDIPYSFMLKHNRFFDRDPRHPTLPGTLARAGYKTAGFVGSGCTSGVFGLERGFDRYDEFTKNERLSDLDDAVPAAVQWLEGRGADPFFLFFHTYDLHAPTPVDLDGDMAVVEYIDAKLSTLFDALREAGLYDDALVILTGDHGSSMSHTQGKCCVHGGGHFEENLNVPLLIKLPGSRERGSRHRIARHVDLYPTVLDVLGLSEPAYDGFGVSLLDRDIRPGFSFSEADARCMTRYALVNARYKYIFTPRGVTQALYRADEGFADVQCRAACEDLAPEEQLFDLAEDPFEDRDLLAAGGEASLEPVLDEFRALMDIHLNLEPQWRRSTRPGQVLESTVSDELKEALAQLGYLR